MAINYYEIVDVVDPLAEDMSIVVSDKLSEDGTGMALITDVLGMYSAFGGMSISFGAPNPASVVLDNIQTALVLAGWEAAFAVNDDVTVDIVNGKFTIVNAGTYTIFANITLEYNITDRIGMNIRINGVDSAANSAAKFRANSVDTLPIPIIGTAVLAVGDTVEISIFAESVGGLATAIAGQFVVSRRS